MIKKMKYAIDTLSRELSNKQKKIGQQIINLREVASQYRTHYIF